MNRKIGKILKNSRQDKGITQEQVAMKMNKSVAAISRWESGEREMNVSDLNRYLDAIKLNDEERERVAYQITFIANPEALKSFDLN